MTEKQALKAGFRIIRGAYHGTTDNRADRWYLDRVDSNTIDRRGPGYRTKKIALDAVALIVAEREEG